MIDLEQVRHALPAHANELIIHECIRLLAEAATPTHREAVAVCRAYYLLPGNEAGGSLHIVLDDGNIDDEFVKWCGEWALGGGEGRGDPRAEHDRDVDPAGWLLSRVILLLTEDERQELYEGSGR